MLSLDHDLGADVMDGTKLCTELLYPDINLNIILPKTDEVFFHSGNFEAVKTMRSKFNSAVKVGLISSLVDNKNWLNLNYKRCLVLDIFLLYLFLVLIQYLCYNITYKD